MTLKSNSSDKIKRRYMLLEAESKDEVERAILDYIGILGWARAAPFFVKQIRNKIILAMERSSVNEIRAAFELSPANIRVIRVSGTIKGLKMKQGNL